MVLRKKLLSVAAVCTLAGILIGLGISLNFDFQTKGFADDTAISEESIDLLSKTNKAMAEVVAAVKPSIVNISSTKTVKGGGISSPFQMTRFSKDFLAMIPGLLRGPENSNSPALVQGLLSIKMVTF